MFSDTGHTDLESEIANAVGRKTDLIFPYRLADRSSDGAGGGGRGKWGVFLEDLTG